MQKWQRWALGSFLTCILAPLIVLIIWDYVTLRREVRMIRARDEVQWEMFRAKESQFEQIALDSKTNTRILNMLRISDFPREEEKKVAQPPHDELEFPPPVRLVNPPVEDYIQQQMELHKPKR